MEQKKAKLSLFIYLHDCLCKIFYWKIKFKKYQIAKNKFNEKCMTSTYEKINKTYRNGKYIIAHGLEKITVAKMSIPFN